MKQLPAPKKQSTNEQLAQEAFELPLVRQRLTSLQSSEVCHLNVNVPSAVAMGLKAAPHVAEHAHQFHRSMTTTEFRDLLATEEHAWALRHAHSIYLALSRPPQLSASAEDQLTDLRDSFLRVSERCAHNCQVDDAPLRQLSQVNDYSGLASDVITLAHFMKNNWLVIGCHTKHKPADLERAVRLAELVFQFPTTPEQKLAVNRASDTRARAFTLFFRSYDQTRRVLCYLLRDKVVRIAPSLTSGLYALDDEFRFAPQVRPFDDDQEVLRAQERIVEQMRR